MTTATVETHRFEVDPIAATRGLFDRCRTCGHALASPLHARPCNDCGVPVGTPHQQGCDVARCTVTGHQRIQCEGELHVYNGREYGEHEGACGDDIWTGAWPGVIACAALGWWCVGPPWRACSPDHPDASPDLNRLAVEARWNPATQRYVKR